MGMLDSVKSNRLLLLSYKVVVGFKESLSKMLWKIHKHTSLTADELRYASLSSSLSNKRSWQEEQDLQPALVYYPSCYSACPQQQD